MYFTVQTGKLLTAATTGPGTAVTLDDDRAYHAVRYHLKSASVTSGAKVNVEVSKNGNDWAIAAQETVTASGNKTGVVNGPVTKIRGNVPAADYTDGNYTLEYEAIRNP